MIDDRQTCDVCGEEFNQDRPHTKHTKASLEKPPVTNASAVLTGKDEPEDIQST